MTGDLASAILGALVGMLATGFLAQLTTGRQLASMDARLGRVERTIDAISYVRVKHRKSDNATDN